MNKILILNILLSGFFSLKSQMFYHGDFYAGFVEDEVELFWGLGDGVGYVFFDELHLFTGIGFYQCYSSSQSSRYER
ncbi:hypothetical protein [Alkalitalea saponilacus]|nr:hypothetical protein [Alkalitalea saponilacus]